MSVSEKDLIYISITPEMEAVASYIAKKRQLFEYPRKGYGDYDSRGISKVKIGVLGEIAFLEFIHKFLSEKTKTQRAKDRWKVLQDKAQFSYHPVIGSFDSGFEFKIGNKTVDIKTYENQVTENQIFKGLKEQGRSLNLFIDKSQNAHADIYVQVFYMKNKLICLAGFYVGLPKLATWMPNPAYACAVPELKPMASLLKLIEL